MSRPRKRITDMAMLFLKYQLCIRRRWLSLKKRCSLLLTQRRRCPSQVYGSLELEISRRKVLDSLFIPSCLMCEAVSISFSLHFPVIFLLSCLSALISYLGILSNYNRHPQHDQSVINVCFF